MIGGARSGDTGIAMAKIENGEANEEEAAMTTEVNGDKWLGEETIVYSCV